MRRLIVILAVAVAPIMAAGTAKGTEKSRQGCLCYANGDPELAAISNGSLCIGPQDEAATPHCRIMVLCLSEGMGPECPDDGQKAVEKVKAAREARTPLDADVLISHLHMVYDAFRTRAGDPLDLSTNVFRDRLIAGKGTLSNCLSIHASGEQGQYEFVPEGAGRTGFSCGVRAHDSGFWLVTPVAGDRSLAIQMP